jgi:DNA-binding MarR family transcriptional regulator
MDQLHLSPAQLHFFIVLPCEVKSIYCSDVALILKLSQSRSSRIIDTLVKEGFVERKNETKDRRRVLLRLTPKGRQIKKSIDGYKNKCEQYIKKNLSDEKLQFVIHSLDMLNQVID